MEYEYTYNDSHTSIAYEVFNYQEQLRRTRNHPVRKAKSKIQLTTKLIKEKKKNLQKCSIKDLKTINRQLNYKEELTMEIMRMREEAALRRARMQSMT